MASRTLRSPYWHGPIAKRARLREQASRHLLEHGFAGLTLCRLTTPLWVTRSRRSYYHDLDALLADVVRYHQEAVAERMTEVVLASRGPPGPERVEALVTAFLNALAAERDGHRAATMILAGMPEAAHAARHHDCWLHGVFAEAIGGAEDERAMLARSLLTLVEDWALRLEDTDAEARALCARLVTRIVTASVLPAE